MSTEQLTGRDLDAARIAELEADESGCTSGAGVPGAATLDRLLCEALGIKPDAYLYLCQYCGRWRRSPYPPDETSASTCAACNSLMGFKHSECPAVSTSHACMPVVEKMLERGIWPLQIGSTRDGRPWASFQNTPWNLADTLPAAICEAARRALGLEGDKP